LYDKTRNLSDMIDNKLLFIFINNTKAYSIIIYYIPAYSDKYYVTFEGTLECQF